MTKEELKTKIDQCVEEIQHYEDIDEYYYGYYYGQLDIYQKWLKEILAKEKD